MIIFEIAFFAGSEEHVLKIHPASLLPSQPKQQQQQQSPLQLQKQQQQKQQQQQQHQHK